MKQYFTIALKPCEEGYLVRVPDVPGCVTGGKTLEEAYAMASDALCGCLCVYEDEGTPVAPVYTPANIPLEEGEFPALIEINLLKYRMETDNRCVRKNVSMPAWLANMVDRNHINCSQVLQDALRRQLQID